MINSRNGFTYLANIVMLSFSMVLFIFEEHSLMQFKVLAITCVILGVISNFFYINNVREQPLSAEAESKEKIFAGLDS
jgi:Na+/melibiose symporter-like transporter